MKQRLAFSSLALLFGSLLPAQANTVTGLDGRLTVIDNVTYYGRQGAAHPNGEIGMAMLNTMCNPGSVNIPWFQAMQPDHPMFGFIAVRVANDKIEQINDYRSYCKHAFLSINVNGSCGSCQNPGTGSLMGINCSDTYGPGNNASRTWLGPAWEIDPWLGTWDPVGSYFDIGHPNQAGYPLPADGSRSLNYNFNSVENRLTIAEQDMLVPGASYFYGLQLIHEGEALANRADNIAHRGFNPTWNGSSWSFPNNSAGQEYGSILDRWTGASVEMGTNGQDDGRVFVASKVTPLGNGQYHYEYAVHNVDSSRGINAFTLPIDATATASNVTFGDLDSDVGNDWSFQRIGNDLVFTNPGANVQEWNMIFNFGFDADYPPGTSVCEPEAARPGPGAISTSVQTEVPGGTTIATFSKFGQGCPISQQAFVPNCFQINPGGGTLTGQTSAKQFVYRAGTTGTSTLLSFRIYTRSTIGTQTVNAYVYPLAGSVPAPNPIATTQVTIGSTPGFYEATLATPVTVGPTFYLGFGDNSQTIEVSNFGPGNSVLLAYTRTGTGPFALELPLVYGGMTVQCTTQPLFPVPTLDVTALPLIGTTYDVQLSDGVPSSAAVLVNGVSNTTNGGLPLPAPLPGAPGCELLVSTESLQAALISPMGTASVPFVVPNNTAFVGFEINHQWAVLDIGANALGIVVSDAGKAFVGS